MKQFNQLSEKGNNKINLNTDTFYDELLLDICVSCGMGFMIEITKKRLQCVKCGFAMIDDDNDLEMH